MSLQQNILDFYRHPTAMTSVGEYTALFEKLPNDVGTLVRVVQGLGIYDVVAPDFYGFNIPDEQIDNEHLDFFDKLAALSRDPDVSFDEMRNLYAEDDRLRVPATVFNSLLNRAETV